MIAAILFVVAGGIALAVQQAPPPPTFRSGVELILLDVTVLDSDGKQIADLQPRDFSIELGGRRRPLVAAQFLRSGRRDVAAAPASGPASGDSAVTAPPAFATAVASLATEARTLFVVVDVENIRSGEGRGAMENLADYFDTLPPTDQIGVIVLPSGKPNPEPTTDRAAVRALLSRTWGASGHTLSCDPTFGEAAAAAAGDGSGLDAYIERAGRGLGCRPTDQRRLEVAIPRYRAQTVALLRNVAGFAPGLGKRPGRRAILLVSEGLYSDETLQPEIAAFGDALDRARVELYAVHLDFPFTEARVKANMTTTRRVDDRYGHDAMADVAITAGGEAIRAVSRPTPALRRIEAALSGAYVVAVERLESDVAGKRMSIKVNVNRRGADVRVRTHLTIGPKK